MLQQSGMFLKYENKTIIGNNSFAWAVCNFLAAHHNEKYKGGK